MSEKIPVKIRAEKILDPQCRWICQRLEANWEMLRLLLVELRDMNEGLKAVLQDKGLSLSTLNPSKLEAERHTDEETPPFLPYFKVEKDEPE